MTITPISHWLRGAALAAAVGLGLALAASASQADEGHGKAAGHKDAQGGAPAKAAGKDGHRPITIRLVTPKMDSEKGMRLFAEKGCVACHSVNGVGGHDATKLDAHTMDNVMNPFEFAAKMWAMAGAMIPAQQEAMGQQITFTGEELAHIIAFVHDDRQQHKFTEAMIPPTVKKLMKHSHGAMPAHQREIGHGPAKH